MATYRNRFGPHNPDETYVAHAFSEQLADLGEVQMNASCDHERMLRAVNVPVLLTHHFRLVNDDTGALMGAISDPACEAGVTADYRSFPTMGHSMHGQDPKLFVDTVVDWASKVLAVRQ